MKKGPIEKYLDRYAEEEVRCLPPNQNTWKYVVCIPACAEAESLFATLEGLSQAQSSEQALVIVVINARASASQAVHASNLRTWEQLRDVAGLAFEPLSFGRLGGLDLLVVDRWSEGRCLPEKQGVGLARKIAGDMALALIQSGRVSEPWIRCTDADVQVPKDYFEQLNGVGAEASAAVSTFVHVPEGDVSQQEAMRLYDAYLQSYVDGLLAAGSPYAFHTIGSLISVKAESYAAVRGIPKRLAGEDFYLLNKLAKVGRVVSLEGAPIRIRGRLSDRVPFGTGAALTEICADEPDSYRPYTLRTFDGLAHWLDALESFVEHTDEDLLRASVQQLNEPLRSALFQTLDGLGAFTAAAEASRQVSGDQLRRRLTEWNDAFRTLKVIHGLRNKGI